MNLWSVCSPQPVQEVFASYDRFPTPPHHFNPSGEEVENVTSIVLQLGRSNLESPFDGLLPYQDWPLVCWTYATNCVSWNIQISCLGCTHRESVKVAVFHLHVSSLSQPPWILIPHSVMVAVCFFPLPASLSMYSDSSHVHIALKYLFQKTHQMLPIPMFHTVCDASDVKWCDGHSMWCTYLSVSVEFSGTW